MIGAQAERQSLRNSAVPEGPRCPLAKFSLDQLIAGAIVRQIRQVFRRPCPGLYRYVAPRFLATTLDCCCPKYYASRRGAQSVGGCQGRRIRKDKGGPLELGAALKKAG